MKGTKLSIVIPFYNRAEYLLETLKSIKAQSFKDYEVLVIDDGSSIEVREIVEEYFPKLDQRFCYIQRPPEYPKGANGCRNYGFYIAQGEYIKWFDSDDLMENEFLAMQIGLLDKMDLDGVLANCGVYNHDFTQKLRSNWRKVNFSENPVKDYVRTQLAWQTGAGMWRKNSIQEINPFSQDLANAQEWVFHLFVLTGNFKVGVVDKELLKIRDHVRSIGRRRNDEEKKYMLNRFKARVIVLSRLIETGNNHKKYVVKSLYEMLKNSRLVDYPEFLKVLIGNLRITPIEKSRCLLVKIENE